MRLNGMMDIIFTERSTRVSKWVVKPYSVRKKTKAS